MKYNLRLRSLGGSPNGSLARWSIVVLVFMSLSSQAIETWNLDCSAVDTGGFHNDAGSEGYYAVRFTRSRFTLEENQVFKKMLTGKTHAEDTVFLTMTDAQDRAVELQCHPVAADLEKGYSCVNTPPSEMLVINEDTLRFTRSSIGGWTFYASRAEQNGDSIYVEYGQCE